MGNIRTNALIGALIFFALKNKNAPNKGHFLEII